MLNKKILKETKKLSVILLSGIIAVMVCGCEYPGNDTAKEETNETTNTEVSGSMETVFMDSRYVSGDTIDEFIENERIKEIVIINKQSENEDDVTKQVIQRDGTGYVLDGNTYKYFYKLTHSANNTTFQEYILSDIIMDEEAYADYMLSSTTRQEGPVVVATNILDAK